MDTIYSRFDSLAALCTLHGAFVIDGRRGRWFGFFWTVPGLLEVDLFLNQRGKVGGEKKIGSARARKKERG